MQTSYRCLTLAFLVLLFAPIAPPLAATANTDSRSSTELEAALNARSEADRARDEARRPAEVIALLGISPGTTVVDAWAGGGWYTEVLSIAVGEDGTVYAQNPPLMLQFFGGVNEKALTERLDGDRLANVVRVDNPLAWSGIEEGSVDVIFTALNVHDVYYLVGPGAAAAMMEEISGLLKPGGFLAVIDHYGDPDGNNLQLHRIDKQIVINLAESAGLTLVADDELLANPDDARTVPVFAPNIRGKTDRFVLKFVKPTD